MIRFKQKGTFKDTFLFLERAKKFSLKDLQKYGEEGVVALSLATPTDTGETAGSWYYEILDTPQGIRIQWLNRNVVDHVNIAVILQYGHATKDGGYIEGRDYINPAMREVFDKIADNAWKEVTGR